MSETDRKETCPQVDTRQKLRQSQDAGDSNHVAAVCDFVVLRRFSIENLDTIVLKGDVRWLGETPASNHNNW